MKHCTVHTLLAYPLLFALLFAELLLLAVLGVVVVLSAPTTTTSVSHKSQTTQHTQSKKRDTG
jgi:hypothetical protein